jgi:LEA14-like dessication related protein
MAHTAERIAAAVMLMGLTGCTTVEERLELRKPEAELVGVKFAEVGPYSATLVFDLQMQNFYPTAVAVRRFKYDVSSGGVTFLSGSAEVRINLPAESQRTVSLPATVNYLEVLKTLRNVGPGATIPYEAKLDVTVDTPRLGPVLLPLTRAGSLSLPVISGAGQPAPAGTAPR